MARIARVVVPGVPHHVLQRSNRRQKVFFSDGDRWEYPWLSAKAHVFKQNDPLLNDNFMASNARKQWKAITRNF